MLTSSLAMYKSSARKVTLSDFIKDNFFMVLLVSSIVVAAILLTILKLLRKARKAEAAAEGAQSRSCCKESRKRYAGTECKIAGRRGKSREREPRQVHLPVQYVP